MSTKKLSHPRSVRLRFIEAVEHLTEMGGVALHQVSESMGFTPSALTNIRTGKTATISEPKVLLFCAKFGVNQAWVNFGVGEMFLPRKETPPPAVADAQAGAGGWRPNLDDLEARLLVLFRMLGPEGRKAVLDFARTATMTPEPNTPDTPPQAGTRRPAKRRGPAGHDKD